MAQVLSLQFGSSSLQSLGYSGATKEYLLQNGQETPFTDTQNQDQIVNVEQIPPGTIPLDKTSIDEIQVNQKISSKNTGYDNGVGFWLGNDSGVYKFFIGDSAGQKLLFDGSNLSITGNISATTGSIGGFNIGTDYIRDAANSFGLSSTVTAGDDIRFWAGATFANRANAPFYVTEAGVVFASDAVINGSTLSLQGFYGDGSDGDIVYSVNTTLTGDVFAENITVDVGVVVNTAGYRIFHTGTMTVNGTIQFTPNAGGNGGNGGNGNFASSGGTAGAAGAAGAAVADGSVPGALAGKAGGVGASGDSVSTGSGGAADDGNLGSPGVAGNDSAKAINSAVAAAGGASGACPGTAFASSSLGSAGRSGGTYGANTGTILNETRSALAAYLLYDPQSGTFYDTARGSGSGAGGCTGGVSVANSQAATGGGGGGGGSGSSGGVVSIFGKTIIISATGSIYARGGDGGNGGNAGNPSVSSSNSNAASGSSGGGGGGGGNGGVILLVYSTLSNAGTISVAGGVGGTAGTSSNGAQTGTGVAGNASSSTNGQDGVAGVYIPIEN